MSEAVQDGRTFDDAEAQPPLNRMVIALLALIGLLISVYLTLHKFGVIGSLVCGTGSCETVQTSRWAVFMGVPVPLLGVVGYFILFVLALIGLQPRNAGSRGLGVALFLIADGALCFSLYLAYLEQFVIHAWCRWCIGSGIITLLIWVFALAELRHFRRAT